MNKKLIVVFIIVIVMVVLFLFRAELIRTFSTKLIPPNNITIIDNTYNDNQLIVSGTKQNIDSAYVFKKYKIIRDNDAIYLKIYYCLTTNEYNGTIGFNFTIQNLEGINKVLIIGKDKTNSRIIWERD